MLRSLAVVGVLAAVAPASAEPKHGGRNEKPVAAPINRLADRLIRAETEAARDAVRREARRLILSRLDGEIIPAWLGTPWGMGRDATARVPHEPGRSITCSGFVIAALENAGLRFRRRDRFVRARALRIQQALAPEVRHLTGVAGDQLAAAIAELGDGLYLVGLRRHIGFVRVAGDRVELIHAGRSGAAAVQREPLEIAEPIIRSRPSGYYVSEVLGDEVVERWLLGRPIEID